MLATAAKTPLHDPDLAYGLCQIDVDLNTHHTETRAGSKNQVTVFDHPVLNGDIKTLKTMLNDYHATVIAPKLWSYGLLR